MVLPAMTELHRILEAPGTSDADRLKAITAVLNRTGYAERQEIDLGLRQPTEWDALGVTIMRGSDDDVDPGPLDDPAAPKGLPAGHDDGEDLARYALDQLDRDRRDRADRTTYLDHSDHDVISGRVVTGGGVDDADGPIEFIGERAARGRARADRPSSLDPDPVGRTRRGPTDLPEYARDRLDEEPPPSRPEPVDPRDRNLRRG